MKTIEVTFKVDLPETSIEPTASQIKEWIEYCCGCGGGCSMSNPLVEYDLEGSDVSIDIIGG